MLVVELAGTIQVLPPPYTQPDPTPFLQLTNIGSAGVQQGIYDIALDPNFATNHFYYVFYTLGLPTAIGSRASPRTRRSPARWPAASSCSTRIPQDANAEHHGGAIIFGNDGKLYFTTGEHFDARGRAVAHQPAREGPPHQHGRDHPDRQPVLRRRRTALGLDLGLRAAQPVPRLLRRANRAAVHRRRRRQRSLDREGGGEPRRGRRQLRLAEQRRATARRRAPARSTRTPTTGAMRPITGGFVYHGTQFPSSYQGSYFFADYTQNWIRRLTLDANGNVTGVFNFEPADGSVDGPYGDIVYLTEGPDGALYYVDLGYSDVGGTFGVSKIRRIRYTQSNQAPVAIASANPHVRADAARR